MMAIEMSLQTLLAGQKLILLETCKKLRNQRMHSVQVEVQYVYVAEALCEYGKAMDYWSDPELLEQFKKFKATFDEYVARQAQRDVAAPVARNTSAPNQQVPQKQPPLQQQPSPLPMAVSPSQPSPRINVPPRPSKEKEGVEVAKTPGLSSTPGATQVPQSTPGPPKVPQSTSEQPGILEEPAGPPRLQLDRGSPPKLEPGSVPQATTSTLPSAKQQPPSIPSADVTNVGVSLRKCKKKNSIRKPKKSLSKEYTEGRRTTGTLGQPPADSVYFNLK